LFDERDLPASGWTRCMALAAFVLAAPGPIDIRFRGLRADFGIPPTVAETSQPKRAGPGKEIDIKSWNGGFK
jgi:hypothetical protein